MVLDDLPLEIVDAILWHVAIPDISSLRLSCRALNDALCSTSRLRHIFQHATVRLTQVDAERFARVTGTPGMWSLLEHCTIAGVAGEFTIDVDDNDRLEQTLAQAFRNVRQLGQLKALKSLSFTMTAGAYDAKGHFVVAKAYHDWHAVWETAPYVWHMVVGSLVAAELEVLDKVDVYSDQRLCSILHDSFLDTGRMMKGTALNPFQRTKQLRVSLGAQLRPATEMGYEGYDAGDNNPPPRVTIGNLLRRTLAWMPCLESLDLHWYDAGLTAEEYQTRELPHTDDDDNDDDDEPSHHLKELTLRGFWATTQTLRRVLRATTPESLTLAHIFLVPGGLWDEVFPLLADVVTSNYCLDDLFQPDGVLYFNGPGSLKFPDVYNEKQWPSILRRQGTEVRRAVEYAMYTSGPATSQTPEKMRWVRANALDYGPQKVSGKYDLIKWLDPSQDTLLWNDKLRFYPDAELDAEEL